MSNPANANALIARLLQHRSLGASPLEELEWLAANGEVRNYQVGDVTTRKAQPEEYLQIVLSGHLCIHLDRGAGARKIIEWRGGDVCGLMPYSRGGAPPGDTVAELPTDTLAVNGDRIPDMIRACPQVTATLVHAMLDRARHFTSSDLHDEKLVSLGKLAAGFAHELNNPASAAARGIKLLAKHLADADNAATVLEAEQLAPAQRETLALVRTLCLSSVPPASRDTLARADREDAMSRWLETHGLDDMMAAPLSSSAVTFDALDTLAHTLPTSALNAALGTIVARLSLRALAGDIETSVSRISELVSAVKGFTYMDRAPVAEAMDIRRGITDTLTILGAKTREKSVEVRVNFAPDLPRVRAYGGELNQVWSNLIDNAIDAATPPGHIDVTAEREQERVVVHIVDHGSGIPAEHLGRIFDPFFTTKPVGQGTGLGLDIVRRLVQRHDGEIDVESRPGRTDVRVSLPIAMD